MSRPGGRRPTLKIALKNSSCLEAAREYTEHLGNSWPSGIDADGRTAIATVFGVPETFFIGPDGVIAGRHIGVIDEATLINGIEAIRRY